MPRISWLRRCLSLFQVPTYENDDFDSEVSAPLYLEGIKEEMRQAIASCSGEHRARALGNIARAGSLMDLWLLRPDVYQYLAQDIGQAEAARRVAMFMPLFWRLGTGRAASVLKWTPESGQT